jgi:hypothetical protein
MAMAINTKPDIPLYIILLFLMVWIIISGSPQRKFKRLKDEFGIKDFDTDKMEEVRKAIEVLNTKSDNIITFDDIIAVKYKKQEYPNRVWDSNKTKGEIRGVVSSKHNNFFYYCF